ncbi:MAG: hypothetical protein Q8O64_01645 [Sideroxyarcus sp.]|nr:hypothetical protein [Sideroxyarcus sp.]
MPSFALTLPRRSPRTFLLIVTFIAIVTTGIMLAGHVFNLVV